MIDFRCNCGFQFSVPSEMAGDMMQCPKCARLVDVPLISELGSLEEDGLYKVDDPPPSTETRSIESVVRAFSRERFDADGFPIDNRGQFTPEPPPEPLPLEPRRVAPPRYDPFTGELIEEIEIVRPVAEAIPVARPISRPLRRSSALMDEPGRYELAALPALLLKPINLLVMFFIFLGNVLAQGMFVVMPIYWAMIPCYFVLLFALIAHFGNVVDETGPTNRQEMPVPLRSLDFGDDIFMPFLRTILALALCYGPALSVLIALRHYPPLIPIALALGFALMGTLVFPAVWLTTMTSGTIANLRHDRVWSVIRALGVEYIVILLTWVTGGAAYVFGLLSTHVMGALIATRSLMPGTPASPTGSGLPPWLRWYVGYPTLAIGIYLLHLLGWQLGTMYRKHHGQFSWVLQRFNPDEYAAQPSGFAVKRLPQQPQPLAARPFPPITD